MLWQKMYPYTHENTMKTSLPGIVLRIFAFFSNVDTYGHNSYFQKRKKNKFHFFLLFDSKCFMIWDCVFSSFFLQMETTFRIVYVWRLIHLRNIKLNWIISNAPRYRWWLCITQRKLLLHDFARMIIFEARNGHQICNMW